MEDLKYLKGEDRQTTPNGELVIDIIKKYSLMLVNSSSLFSRLRNRFDKNTRPSVLDYAIKSHEKMQHMKNMNIDDSRCSSLYKRIKEKDDKHRVVHSDHFLIFIDLNLEITEPKV